MTVSDHPGPKLLRRRLYPSNEMQQYDRQPRLPDRLPYLQLRGLVPGLMCVFGPNLPERDLHHFPAFDQA